MQELEELKTNFGEQITLLNDQLALKDKVNSQIYEFLVCSKLIS